MMTRPDGRCEVANIGMSGVRTPARERDLWVLAVAPKPTGNDHEFAHQTRMPDGDLQRALGTQRKSEYISPVESQVRDQGGGIVGHLLVREGTIRIQRMAVCLWLNRDDPPALRERRNKRPHQGR